MIKDMGETRNSCLESGSMYIYFFLKKSDLCIYSLTCVSTNICKIKLANKKQKFQKSKLIFKIYYNGITNT
jgi:hypothetical protein